MVTMATRKRIKKVEPEKKPAAKIAPTPKENVFTMPVEVKDWIDRANSIMNHLKGEIERLKQENKELKQYKRWAEHRILRSDNTE